MLSPQDNDILCRVGPGTPMGDALRRFWVPACLSDELAQPDSGPIRLRILGEDLVAFRDSKGRVGLVEAYCPHKLANLYWGPVENCALSCAYHGWTFDADGNCLATPNEPEHAEMRVAGYTSAVVTVAPDPIRLLQSGGVHIHPHMNLLRAKVAAV